MFKKFQNRLLINNPLLWNTKVIAATGFALVFHVVFFVIGYFSGNVDFADGELFDFGMDDGIVIFFSVLISLLFFVIWFYYYSRNNGFKAFYPVTAKSLYFEWLIILLVCFLNITYSVTYFVGQSLKSRSYYSEAETLRRVEVISMAAIFIDGPFQAYSAVDHDRDPSVNYTPPKYAENSLFNKNTEYFNYSSVRDSEKTINNWMVTNNRQKIRQLMRDYLAINNEHELPANVTADQWFELTYNYPDFVKYELIGRRANEISHRARSIETVNRPYFKYYVSHDALVKSYTKIYRAWKSPLVEEGLLYALLYTAISLAMLLFSFKVTDARNWLFALIAMGLLWVTTGIFSALTGSGLVFLYFWLVMVLGFLCYFFIILFNKRGKQLTAIALNLALWSFAGVLPLLYGVVMEYYNQPEEIQVGDTIDFVNTPQYNWLNDHASELALLNFIAVVVAMAVFCHYIKRLKGLAEA